MFLGFQKVDANERVTILVIVLNLIVEEGTRRVRIFCSDSFTIDVKRCFVYKHYVFGFT